MSGHLVACAGFYNDAQCAAELQVLLLQGLLLICHFFYPLWTLDRYKQVLRHRARARRCNSLAKNSIFRGDAESVFSGSVGLRSSGAEAHGHYERVTGALLWHLNSPVFNQICG